MKWIFIGCLIPLLVSCGHRFEEAYLIRHPETLQATLLDCQSFGEAAINDHNCIFAQDVLDHARAFSQQLMTSPQRFGQNILKKQIRLAQLDTRLAAFSRTSSQVKPLFIERTQLRFQLNIMLALIASAQNL